MDDHNSACTEASSTCRVRLVAKVSNETARAICGWSTIRNAERVKEYLVESRTDLREVLLGELW